MRCIIKDCCDTGACLKRSLLSSTSTALCSRPDALRKTHDALCTVSKHSLTSQNTQDAFTQCPNNNRISLYLMPFIVSHSLFLICILYLIFLFHQSAVWCECFFFSSCLPPRPPLESSIPLKHFQQIISCRKKRLNGNLRQPHCVWLKSH